MTSIDNCYKPEIIIKILEEKYLQNIDSISKEIIIIGYNIICQKTCRKQSIDEPENYRCYDSSFELYLDSYKGRLRSLFYLQKCYTEKEVEQLLDSIKDFESRDRSEIAEDLYYEALYGGSIFYKKRK